MNVSISDRGLKYPGFGYPIFISVGKAVCTFFQIIYK